MNKMSIKDFWEAQARKSHLSNEAISSLEEDPELSNLRVETEKSKILPIVHQIVNLDSSILDLGGGAGQWALRFSSIVREVSLVEFSDSMIKLAIDAVAKNKVDNINFFKEPAQNFCQSKTYDLIWISGLLIYLDDNDCENLIKNAFDMLTPNGTILLRDGTGLEKRHQIKNKFSKSLQLEYSATYRTTDEYEDLFSKHGFELVSSDDMFKADSPLNKWKETRLRLYEFKNIIN